jgi:hypothetical protein
MKELSVIEAKERNETLTKLAGEIMDLFLSAQHKAKRTADLGRESVREVLLCGLRLIEAKRVVKHKKWIPWLKENCPDITPRTAQNWMRLAKTKHVSHLDTCANLSAAYRVCGILPEPAPQGAKPEHPITVEDLLRFAGFAAKLTPETFSSMTIPDEHRVRLRERLKPAHDAYLALL